MASYNTSFNFSKLKLAHINICCCRKKETEISLFLKENDIDILTLNQTWFRSKFMLDIPNYIINRNDIMLICSLLKTHSKPTQQTNSKPTHRDRTNTSDIIDYIISLPAIYNSFQNLTLNNDLSFDNSAILLDFFN